ncbi:VOC family protein [Lampropedia aestuarii]|uniref:VOC family protein n=1 Tax=Lampropedia aestuarii TaxID=2562762 RepID=A0A4S5BR87_9BURK|nr:VOC family protein [Lampropedia aestuarii]THJ35287.1 VOC family protein [Lampropedia aestuarii]
MSTATTTPQQQGALVTGTGVYLDHLAVVCQDLQQGVTWLESVLGVRATPGGQHPRMATHNALLRLGEGLYLEVIAPQAGVPLPAQPRWFALDNLQPGSLPHLAMWVLRNEGAPGIAARVEQASEALGPVQTMSRGERQWQITIPSDGSIPVDGAGPALIEWQAGPAHPAQTLPEQGLSLQRLRIGHPQPERLQRLADSLQWRYAQAGPEIVFVQTLSPSVSAEIMTPSGLRVLPGRG